MKRASLLTAIILLLSVNLYAADLNLIVETDKATYRLGETVNWEIWVSTSMGDNDGIAALDINLNDNRDEALFSAETTGGVPDELQDSSFNTSNGYTLYASGSERATPPRLRGICVFQDNKMFNFGNDGSEYLYAKGSYTITKTGPHTLSASPQNGNNYWLGDGAGAFNSGTNTPATFDVLPAELNIRVATDKSTYKVGDEVDWQIWVSTSIDVFKGIKSIDIDLSEDRGEELFSADTTGSDPNSILLSNSAFIPEFGYKLTNSGGTENPSSPRLSDIKADQSLLTIYDYASDGSEYLYAEGTYTITKAGPHSLSASLGDDNYYWTESGVELFAAGSNDTASFNVTLKGDVNNDMYVNLLDVAAIAEDWLGCTDPSNPDCDEYWNY